MSKHVFRNASVSPRKGPEKEKNGLGWADCRCPFGGVPKFSRGRTARAEHMTENKTNCGGLRPIAKQVLAPDHLVIILSGWLPDSAYLPFVLPNMYIAAAPTHDLRCSLCSHTHVFWGNKISAREHVPFNRMRERGQSLWTSWINFDYRKNQKETTQPLRGCE